MPGTVEGLSDFLASTRQLPDALADELGQAELAIGEAILAAANPPRVSGTLDRSQSVEVTPGGARLVATAPYAGVIRYGWPARNITANDWLTPALAAADQAATDLATQAVTDAITHTY